MKQNEAPVTDGFEKSMHTLLSRAYDPVECREEFRAQLLGRLKTKQREVVTTRRARRRRRIALYSFASMAAAASFLLFAMPLFSATLFPIPGDTPGIETTHIAMKPDAGQPSVVLAEHPADAVAAAAVENDEPMQQNQLVEFNQIHLPPISRKQTLPMQTVSPVQFCASGKGNWQTLSADSEVHFAPRGQLRAPEDSGGDVGIWIDDDILLSLKPGAIFENLDGELTLNCGTARIETAEGSRPLLVHVPDYELRVDPGSELLLRVFGGGDYAEGGEPAPYAAVLSGNVTASSKIGHGKLLAGYEYELFGTYVGGLPGRPIGEVRRKELAPAPAPSLRTGHAQAPLPTSPGEAFNFLKQRPALRATVNLKINGKTMQRQVYAIDGRLFVLKGKRWIDAAYRPDVELTSIRFQSQEYRKLMETSTAMRKYAFYLRPAMIVHHEGTWYEITKLEATVGE